ncbi:aromatic amino acid DMT transporter YddG [Atlantibacter sp.]|uniref:aromatic amino acid DMT transporter YddG n=1 Tax=Atlantibacter sp. TaxID=1903473 RepID=UPI0028AB6D17|nr:aromatic amino acid DMT transporter YddG [Atlantibacter sp.]
MQTPVARATLIGLIAILLWSTSVGLFRSIAEHFGAVGGPALIYTLSACCLWLAQGRPRLEGLPLRYMLVGGGLFVAYEMCLALSIGFAHNRSQSLELGMINYLWPSLTVLFALWLNNQRSTWLIWPGLLLAIGGVAQVMKGNGDWSPVMMWRNILDNPLAYSLAFAAAITWALYCNLTRRWSNGKSGVTLFFCATALALWVHYALSSEGPIAFTLSGTLQLCFMGLSTAVAYSAWNHGISHGNMTLLATASYFTPVSSALLASLWLGLTPGISFWQGVAMVVAGSLLCWLATRR